MLRHALVPAAILLAPGCIDTVEDPGLAAAARAVELPLVREHVAADVFHYTVTLPLGDAPNARLRIHRIVRESSPWRPRPTASAAMLLHGDFSTFVTNFAGEPAPLQGLVWIDNSRLTNIPEPAAAALGLMAMAGLAAFRRRVA